MIGLLRRLFDRQRPERHPVREQPGMTLAQQVAFLREHVALLHDEVWWLSRPWYKRLGWWLLGYRAPIERFYEVD